MKKITGKTNFVLDVFDGDKCLIAPSVVVSTFEEEISIVQGKDAIFITYESAPKLISAIKQAMKAQKND
jgi:hypothetical protein